MAEKKDETQKLQLLSLWASPFSQRVEIALALKGIDCEKLPQILAQKSPLLLASNPVYKKIPVLLHGDRAICESSIIIQYIDEAFADHHHQFLPEDAYGRATARFWADFVDKKLFEGVSAVLKTQGEEEKQAAAIENVMACFETFDEALGKVSGEGSPFFGGEKMGFVDIMFAPFVCWYPAMEAATEGFQFPFQEKFPHLHAWLHAFRKSSVASVLPQSEKIIDFSMIYKIKKAVSST